MQKNNNRGQNVIEEPLATKKKVGFFQNLLLPHQYKKFSKYKRMILKHVLVVRLFLVVFLMAGFYLLALFFGSLARNTLFGDAVIFIKSFILATEDQIESIGGQTNVLILGKGGAGHDAPDLTDTIMFVSTSHTHPSTTLISLPRDIWISALRAKLNSAYYWGNQKKDAGGMLLAKSSVEEIVGRPVQYGVVIDFAGFKNVIDVLGGISVDVENSFTDESFPISGLENDTCDGDPLYLCRYETISFEKGIQVMDGETALKFARSRHSEGDEGTDIARGKRQQKILSGLQEKVLSTSVMFSPTKIRSLVGVIKDSIETDIGVKEAGILLRRIFQSRDGLQQFVLPEELLVNPPLSSKYDNLYVFIPSSGNWNEVRAWTNEVINQQGK